VKAWRRNFYGYLAHGMTMVNVYEFRPLEASYTENYVDNGRGMYEAVRKGLWEMSTFEDIIQTGRIPLGSYGC
jgi:hypothetical protein